MRAAQIVTSRATAAFRRAPGGWRCYVGKGGNRPATHGAKTPVSETVKREETEAEIEKGKKENQKKREEVENEVGLKPNNPGLQSGG